MLRGLCANDNRAAAALAVPFLIPIATDAHHPNRAAALDVLSHPARARYFGVASREELLLHRSDPRRNSPEYDDYGVEWSGSAAGWSVAAARSAITAGTPALLAPLDDTDRTIRIDAVYVLATAADPDRSVRSALATRLTTQRDAMVRAVAETTRAHTPADHHVALTRGGTTGQRPPKPAWPRL
ncbi:hypothetical protein [Streptomyces sp. SAI-170]|uniref:hypothetical protein n=1 Tax=Streptomyces sp. SAI-170 TaxID=3377729 RepID=UPI003C7A0236